MPELTPQSTAALEDPLFQSPPPTHDPDFWESFPVFRESFLMYVTRSGYSTAFRVLGQMLYELLLETPTGWPEWEESATRTEMRAAIGDMRHLQGFLASIGQERHVSSLDAGDFKLSKHASKVARLLNQVATTLERKLATGATS